MSGLASIDDLLEHEDDGAGAGPSERGGAVWSLVKDALVAAGLALGAKLLLGTAQVGLPYALLFAGFFALLMLRRVLRGLRPAPTPRARRAPSTRDESDYVFGTGDALRSALVRWENRLEWVRDDPPRFTSTVRAQLAEVVDERLRQRHGVRRAADPERARRLLGDRLWRFLTEPVVRPHSPREMAELLGDVERI